MTSQQSQQLMTRGSPWAKDPFSTFPSTEVGEWGGGRDVFDPMSFINSIGEIVPRSLDYPLSNRTNQPQNEISRFSPILSADFYETDTDYHVHLDLPGVSREDLEVALSNGELTIKAERKHNFEVDTVNVRRRERTLGRVQRVVPIPSNCNPELAEVDFVNGCLEVSLPKIIPGPTYSRTLTIGTGKSSASSAGGKGRKG